MRNHFLEASVCGSGFRITTHIHRLLLVRGVVDHGVLAVLTLLVQEVEARLLV